MVLYIIKKGGDTFVRYNSGILLEQLNLFFKHNDLNAFIEYYKNRKWNVLIDRRFIEIRTQKNTYHLGIIEKRDKYFWDLSIFKNTCSQALYKVNINFFSYWFKVIEDIEKT